MMSKEQLKMLL